MTINRIWACAYNATTGALGDRWEFARLGPGPGLPNGATVDSEGGYWIAAVGGGCLYWLTPDGEVDRVVELPVAKPTKPIFGGRRLDKLYLTSIGANPAADDTQAGGLFMIEGLGMRGLPDARLAG